MEPPIKTLLIFFDETDMWEDRPLSEVLVRMLAQRAISGATVLVGGMGFGTHGRIHRKGLFGVSDDKPVMLVIVENEKRLRDVLPAIRPMVKEGLFVLLDAELIP